MNAGATADRVYEALRERILAHAYRPGDRLDPASLGKDLAASVTPARDALNRLVGEDLVETRHGSGFFLPPLDEPALKDLYAWSSELAQLALRGWRRAVAPIALDREDADGNPASETSQILAAIARRSPNFEHVRALDRVNARLQAVRVIEPLVLAGTDVELRELRSCAIAMDKRRLAILLRSYHRRRVRASGDLVRAVYRAV